MRALAIAAPGDRLLSTVAPLGLACAAGTALVIDLDPHGPDYPGSGSLADIVAAGPRLADLRPRREGVAVLRNGGIDPELAREVVEAFLEGWPAVVLRLGAADLPPEGIPRLQAHAVFPGMLNPPVGDKVVYQRTSLGRGAPGPGPILPRPGRGQLMRLLNGIAPGPSRWVRAWREVWQWA